MQKLSITALRQKLFQVADEALESGVSAAIERGRLAVSPIVDLELQYLHEIGRIGKGPAAVLSALSSEIGLALDPQPLEKIVGRTRELHWPRDPFDRLIVASALLAGGRLVTKDTLIRKHCKAALW